MIKENGFYKWKKGEKEFLGQYFNTTEFNCSCSRCTDQLIAVDLIEQLDRLRIACGKTIIINSGYRCPEHNKEVGGKENSQHLLGMAVDLRCPSLRLDELLPHIDSLFNNVGISTRPAWVHVDIRPLKNGTDKRRWYY